MLTTFPFFCLLHSHNRIESEIKRLATLIGKEVKLSLTLSLERTVYQKKEIFFLSTQLAA